MGPSIQPSSQAVGFVNLHPNNEGPPLRLHRAVVAAVTVRAVARAWARKSTPGPRFPNFIFKSPQCEREAATVYSYHLSAQKLREASRVRSPKILVMTFCLSRRCPSCCSHFSNKGVFGGLFRLFFILISVHQLKINSAYSSPKLQHENHIKIHRVNLKLIWTRGTMWTLSRMVLIGQSQ